MNVGEKIKKFRLLKNMKQSDLADKANVSRVAIGNYERNERTPTVDVIVKIAKALSVSPNDLMSWDEMYPNIAIEVDEFEEFVLYLKSLNYDVTTFSDSTIVITYEGKSITLSKEEFSNLQKESKKAIQYALWRLFEKEK